LQVAVKVSLEAGQLGLEKGVGLFEKGGRGEGVGELLLEVGGG
jgi:exonuclease VII small subunit